MTSNLSPVTQRLALAISDYIRSGTLDRNAPAWLTDLLAEVCPPRPDLVAYYGAAKATRLNPEARTMLEYAVAVVAAHAPRDRHAPEPVTLVTYPGTVRAADRLLLANPALGVWGALEAGFWEVVEETRTRLVAHYTEVNP